jgi:hypothetical protein
VEIFGLPGFVEDRGQICFSRGSLPHFFLHVRDPRKLENRETEASEKTLILAS